jgi:hypothetical protein
MIYGYYGALLGDTIHGVMKRSKDIFERLKQAREPQSTPTRDSSTPRKPMEMGTWIIIILGLLMLVFLFNCVVGFVFLEEDAFIDFRYSQNLADGKGFVFNTGEKPVEGYSNFLWLVIIYMFQNAGSDPVAIARVLGILLGVATMYFSFLAMRGITGREGALNLLPPAMIAFSPPLIYWYQGGLETALFSFLIVVLLHLHLKENEIPRGVPLSGFICLLLALTRPEGIIFFVLFVILKLRPALADDNKLRTYIMWFFMCFIPLLLFVAFRYATFHALLPNTYYAKVNYSIPDAIRIGGIYTLGFLSDSRAWFWLIPFLGVLARLRGVNLWRNFLPLIMVLTYVLFVLYVGGDFHIHFRFFAPLLPLLFIMCALGIREIIDGMNESGKAGLAKIAALILALLVIVVSSDFYRSPAWRDINQVSFMDRSMLSYRYQVLIKDPGQFNVMLDSWFKPPGDILDKTGKWLADNYPPETRLATDQCGKIPFYTGFYTYDLLGLNSVETARIIHYKQSFDQYLEAFNAADADIVVLYYDENGFVDKQHVGALVESREFQANYELVKILEFEYIYKLDKEYSRPRQMLLFERRSRPVEIDEAQPVSDEESEIEAAPDTDGPLKIDAWIEQFRALPTSQPVEGEEEETEGEETVVTQETQGNVVTFVVEL